jgi:butyrate kinase
MRIFVINPGSTSTKLALVEIADAEATIIERRELSHPGPLEPAADLARRHALLEGERALWQDAAAIAAQGGLLGPVPAGVYAVTEALVTASLSSPYGFHPANLAAPLADALAKRLDRPAFVVDPPSVDEMVPVSRISGVPGVARRSRVHALNLRFVARRLAETLGAKLEELTLAGAHLGGGSTCALFQGGRMIDTTDGLLGEGPFSPNRAGTVPIHGVLSLIEQHGLDGAKELLARRSGFLGLLGTQDLRELSSRALEPAVAIVIEAYALSVAKALAGLAAHVRPQAFFLTGGAARFEAAVNLIKMRLEWLAPVYLYPGEFEAEALALGVYRVIRGLEPNRFYPPSP